MNKSLRRRWIIALTKTVDQYESILPVTRTSLNMWVAKECPLCALVDETDSSNCDACIHNSSFGAGTYCTHQKSFRRIRFASDNPGKNVTGFIKYRIYYLESIIKRLKQ